MSDTKRVDPETARDRMQQSDDMLLVCAYEDDGKCRDKHIEGAITLSELQQRSPSKEQEIVFYCA